MLLTRSDSGGTQVMRQHAPSWIATEAPTAARGRVTGGDRRASLNGCPPLSILPRSAGSLLYQRTARPVTCGLAPAGPSKHASTIQGCRRLLDCVGTTPGTKSGQIGPVDTLSEGRPYESAGRAAPRPRRRDKRWCRPHPSSVAARLEHRRFREVGLLGVTPVVAGRR